MDAWEITVCPDCGQRVSGGYPVCTVDDKPHYAPDKTESVEVVRAADHQGAVEALRAIAEDRVPHPDGYDVTVPPTVQAYAQGALTRFGGR